MTTGIPDLSFIHEEAIEFYKKGDDLEVKTYNVDSDVCIITLTPDEVRKLIEYLAIYFG